MKYFCSPQQFHDFFFFRLLFWFKNRSHIDAAAISQAFQNWMIKKTPKTLHIIFMIFLGIIGHKEPILPRGDPNAERPQPQLHLDAPLHDDNAIREEIIKEEEAKENAIIEDVLESESETLEDETPAPLIEPNQINADLEKVFFLI